jgi:hypothetical protein
MAINIQDNFDLNVSLPIDSRIVKSGVAQRDAISFKYNGLQVFDVSDRKTYVWNVTGSTWSFADVSGTGDTNTLAKWSSTAGLTSSALLIVNDGTNNRYSKVGLNVQNTGDIKGTLHINPSSGSSQPIVISNAGNSNSFIAFNHHYTSGSDNYFNLTAGSAAIKFRDNGELWFYVRENGAGSVMDVSDSTISTANDAVMIMYPTGGSGNGAMKIMVATNWNSQGDSGSAALIRSTNVYSSATTPDFTWWYNDQTGFYHPSADVIGITTGGVARAIINNRGLLVRTSGSILGGIASSTSTGLCFQLDGGAGNPAYMQITNGSTSGTTFPSGLVIGISADAIPSIQNRTSSKPIFWLVGSNGNSRYRFSSNKFDMYSNINGENSATLTTAETGGGGSRVVRGTKLFTTAGSAGIYTVETLSLPNDCQVAIECTFVSSKLGPPSQFTTHKFIAHYTVGSAGAVTSRNTGTGTTSQSGKSLAMLSSSSTTQIINPGTIDISTNNQLKMIVQFGAGNSGASVVSYTATINAVRGV